MKGSWTLNRQHKAHYPTVTQFLKLVHDTIECYYGERGAYIRLRSLYAHPPCHFIDLGTQGYTEVQLVDEVLRRRQPYLPFTELQRGFEQTLADAIRQKHNNQLYAGGRLVAFAPNETVTDGASENVSHGYFDVCDEPGWDTWVTYIIEPTDGEKYQEWQSYLISWVPEDYVSFVNDATDVTITHCIEWLDAIDTPFSRKLKAAGVL